MHDRVNVVGSASSELVFVVLAIRVAVLVYMIEVPYRFY